MHFQPDHTLTLKVTSMECGADESSCDESRMQVVYLFCIQAMLL